jgi:hypothetical protein
MAYEKKISRAQPGLIGLILDDSGSMADNLPGTSDPKYQWVERYFGNILHELLARSSEVKGNDAIVKPRWYLTTVKYGTHPELWGSPESDIQTVVELFSRSGNSLGLGGNLNGTDTEAAFAEMLDHLKNSLAGERFKNAFPPMIFHLSDGQSATDATAIAEEMKRQTTADGQTLLVNAYVGTQASLSYNGPEDFPGYLEVPEVGSSPDNIRLFAMSSVVPPSIEANLKADGIFPQIRPGSRLFFDVRTKEMLKHVLQVVGSLGSRMAR